jgi:hypothetical protein
LALEAWKLEHGQLPQSLDQLTGRYLDHPPVDPFWGKLFQYYPRGVEFAFRDTRGKAVEPGTPFLWGPATRAADSDRSNTCRAGDRSMTSGDAAAPSVPPEKMLPLGFAFAIP